MTGETREPVAAVTATLDAFNRRDQEAWLAFYDAEVELLAYGETTPMHGHAGMREWWDSLLTAFPDWQMTPVEVRELDGGLLVSTRNVGSGGASGVDIDATVWTALSLRDEQIVWWGTFATEQEASDALGRRRSPASSPTVGSERIAAAFAAAGKRAALMPYVMAGYPRLEDARAIGEAYADAGADLVEVGVPFSDPLADGPVIHAAGTAALRAGVTTEDALELAGALSARLPVVLMAYVNLVLAHGIETFMGDLADRGVSGLIVPDLSLEESPPVLEAADAAGVALVPLVAPTTPEDRLEAIGAQARGFLYAVSVVGTTGERESLSAGVGPLVERAAAHTEVPVAVGFGIGTPEQAAEVADAGADGVIVASRLVRAAGDAEDPAGTVRDLVSAFARALE